MEHTAQATTRILLVDDHPIMRQGYTHLIGNQPGLEICGSASSEQEALERADATAPHLAIVDITLKDSNGIELVKALRSRYEHITILVVSAHDENLYAERALEAGALGYVNKQEATDKLIDGIRSVLAGRVFVSDAITKRLLRHCVGNRKNSEGPPIESLTNRELEVFESIGLGQTTRVIADKLRLSPKTVERHKENIKLKLNIPNATELVQHATRWVIEKR